MTDNKEFVVFPWNKNFETGIAPIDEQHIRLVQLINKLASHLSAGSDIESLEEVFGELASYADYHFKTEEQIWATRLEQDPWFAEHKRTHDSFLPQVLALKQSDKADDSPLTILTPILKFLVNWLVFHILDNDRRMAKALLAVKDGLTVEEAKQRADKEKSGLMRTFVDTIMVMYEEISVHSL